MKGGESWWQQIQEVLKQVEYLVLVMTPGSMASEVVREEWMYARQQGVCVLPVIAAENLNISSLPRWMSKVHFYDLGHEMQWERFVNDLNTCCEQSRVLFKVENLPDNFVERHVESEQLVKSLLDENRENAKAITIALKGAGGFGKTTLAAALCRNYEIQQAYHDGILWVTLGEHPGDLIGKLSDLIIRLTGENPGYATVDAASDYLAELLIDREMLIVIDDVWDSAHLRPFLKGGERCARLITTRNSDVLPTMIICIDVNEMEIREAVQLLRNELQGGDQSEFQALAKRLGNWPLLLKLVNARLREHVRQSEQSPNVALKYANKVLDQRSVTGFDIHDSSERSNAVDVTLKLSLELLEEEEIIRFLELSIFPEDVDVPLDTLVKYWGKTAGMDYLDAGEFCRRLYRLSLLEQYTTKSIKIHDVIRHYLIEKAGKKNIDFHETLLGSYGLQQWADIPEDEPYLWNNLAYHMLEAGQSGDAYTLLTNCDYLEKKHNISSIYNLRDDYLLAIRKWCGDENQKKVLVACEDCLRVVGIHIHQTPELLLPYLYNYLIGISTEHQPPISLSCVSEHAGELGWLRSVQNFKPEPSSQFFMMGHIGSVNTVAFTSDGSHIVSGSDDQTIKIWDFGSGKLLRSIDGHDNINSITVTPDNSQIVSGSDNKLVKVWDLENGQLSYSLEGHRDSVNAVAVTSDGKKVVSGSDDNLVKIWYLNSGEVRDLFEEYSGNVNTVAITPDGKKVVSGYENGSVKLWDLESQRFLRSFEGHRGSVSVVAISRNGSRIISGADDNIINIWDLQSGELLRTLDEHTDSVEAIAISLDNLQIISGADDNTIKIWDLQTGKLVQSFERHKDHVKSIAVRPKMQSTQIISGSKDKTIKAWNLNEKQQIRSFEGHQDRVNTIALTADGTRVVSGADDSVVRVWDLNGGGFLHSFEKHTNCVRAVAITPDGRQVISGGDDKTIQVWDLNSGEQRYSIDEKDRVRSVTVTPDGSRIVSTSDDKTIKVWKLEGGKFLHAIEGTDYVRAIAMTHDGSGIVSGSDDGIISVWDIGNGKLLRSIKTQNGIIKSVAVMPDNSKIISGAVDGIINIWNPYNKKLLPPFEEHFRDVLAVAVTPDSSQVISGSDDKTVNVLNWRERKLMYSVQKGYRSGVSTVAVTSDGLRVISGSDKLLSVWDLGDKNLGEHIDSVKSLLVVPDKLQIISGSDDKTVKIWDLYSGRLQRTLKHAKNVNVVSITPDGSKLFFGIDGGAIQIFDLVSGEPSYLKGHGRNVNALALTSDGSLLISGADDATVKIWDWANKKLHNTLATRRNEEIKSVALRCDFQVVSGAVDGVIEIFDLENGDLCDTLKEHTDRVNSIVVTSDNSKMISGSSDKTIQIWDFKKRERLCSLENPAEVYAVALIPSPADDLKIVFGSSDGTIKIWEPKRDGENDAQELFSGNESIMSLDIKIIKDRYWVSAGDKKGRVWTFEWIKKEED